ncbi:MULTISPECIES: pyridoxine/pyridoxamine 5'-phosphate oxidase [Subtercola]|uniref:Pyridoxamine 5'-phosphate oxidase n=1 Tax=Subtercola vilae TaxID=2056433 RepID=A0A4T2CFL9_9MICO|nr:MULTISPECIES: pyridoxamine 5'-phosphate oxidase family protein [Subtercola]MEA9983981.1 pyridoxamine 5'-phosphate oxidase family protein [Subtercola sp. RTI3]TIH40948.1 pyridoxamine 5'-phosphate oxidase [Subtercola vilae]
MSDTFRRRLRALPDFAETLPSFDPEAAPDDPAELFVQWLDEAIAAGIRQPHAFSLATALPAAHSPVPGADGATGPALVTLSSRMLILKNLDEGGWQFASSRTSRKGRELEANPFAALNFYWADLGRQVRVAGPVTLLSAEASALDWSERPAADARPNPTWQLYAVQPTEVEFWQASHDRHHIRHSYTFPA